MKKILLTIIPILIISFISFGQNESNSDMVIVDVKTFEQKKTPHDADVKVIYNKDNAQAVHIELKPGESLKPHITPVDVFFYVLEGEATIMVGDEMRQVSPDQLVESPKDIKHCIYNKSDKKVRVLVVKAPKPTTSTKIL